MTLRQKLSRRARWLGRAMYAGLGVLLAGIVIGQFIGGQPILAVAVPGFAVTFAVGIVAHFVGFRCCRCYGNLAPVIMHHGWRSVDPGLRFCPYCGWSLDHELPVHASAELSQGADNGSATSGGRM